MCSGVTSDGDPEEEEGRCHFDDLALAVVQHQAQQNAAEGQAQERLREGERGHQLGMAAAMVRAHSPARSRQCADRPTPPEAHNPNHAKDTESKVRRVFAQFNADAQGVTLMVKGEPRMGSPSIDTDRANSEASGTRYLQSHRTKAGSEGSFGA